MGKICGSEVAVKGKRVFSAQSTNTAATASLPPAPMPEALRSLSPSSVEEEPMLGAEDKGTTVSEEMLAPPVQFLT